jgi:hypothetical protein
MIIEPKYLKDAEMYMREFHKDCPQFKEQRGYDPLWLIAYTIKRLKGIDYEAIEAGIQKIRENIITT